MKPTNFRHLECFFAVAEELHFGRAAQGLHLSQASVSEAITALERTLGAPLFTRSTRRVTLTPFGQEFRVRARPPWDELGQAYNWARTALQQEAEIVIGHTPELGHVMLPPLIEGLACFDRSILWRPSIMHTKEQLHAVAEGTIDLGLCWTPNAQPPVSSIELAICPFVVVVRSDDELATMDRIRLDDLQGRRLVASPRHDHASVDWRLQAALLENGIDDADIEQVGGWHEIALRVASRSVVAIHPASIILANRVPGLTFRPLDEPELAVTICAVFREDDEERLDHILRVLKTVVPPAIEFGSGHTADSDDEGIRE